MLRKLLMWIENRNYAAQSAKAATTKVRVHGNTAGDILVSWDEVPRDESSVIEYHASSSQQGDLFKTE